MSHTILLVQPGIKPETRTYSDYESVNECMEGVCKIYEEHLKRTNPNLPSITYDISQLFEFVDQVLRIFDGNFDATLNLFSCPTSRVWSTRSPPTHTPPITKTGSKRRSTSSCEGRPARQTKSLFVSVWIEQHFI